MTLPNREAVVKFLRRAVLSTVPCVRIKVLHLVSGNAAGASVIWDGDLNSQEDTEPETKRLLSEVEGAIESDAGSFTRVQSYGIQALGPNDKPIGMCRCRVAPDPDSIMAVDDTEPPTGAGTLALSLRHTDALGRAYMGSIRTQVEGTDMLLRNAYAEVQRLSSRCAALESKLADSYDMREQLMSKQHERDIELLEVSNKNERIDKAIGMGKTLLPFVIKKLNADATGAQPKQLEQFVGMLSGDQLTTILETLDEGQREKLNTILTGVPEVPAPAKSNGKGDPNAS